MSRINFYDFVTGNYKVSRVGKLPLSQGAVRRPGYCYPVLQKSGFSKLREKCVGQNLLLTIGGGEMIVSKKNWE